MDPASELPRQEGQGASYRTGEAVLAVTVPEEAKVFVNGVRTSSTGSSRQYVSRGLLVGYTYTYEVRVEIERDGEIVEDTKTAYLRVGENSRLAFDLPKVATPTTLTLKVPANAKVFLGGNETSAKGTVRTFTTTHLRDGQEWSSYKVRIEFEQDGEQVVKESTIALKAGDQRTLEVGTDVERVASKQ